MLFIFYLIFIYFSTPKSKIIPISRNLFLQIFCIQKLVYIKCNTVYSIQDHCGEKKIKFIYFSTFLPGAVDIFGNDVVY